ncbi:MAG: respiratory nitrate reductase subunit gamma, partial [Spirochaetota bacterium]
MLNGLIFILMPYLALGLLLFVTPWRFVSNRLSWSAYSTQFLERENLFWGINPWHYGILPVLLAHFLAVLFPGPMKAFLGNQGNLIAFESLGLAFGLFALLGCLLLLLRRATKPILKQVTYAPDWILLLLLAAQSLTGVYVATFMNWGSEWALYTAVPYLWSLATFT